MTCIAWRPPTSNRTALGRLVAMEDRGVRFVAWGWWCRTREKWIREETDEPFSTQPYAVADAVMAPEMKEVRE